MQFPGQQVAFLRYSRFHFKGIETQVFHTAGQMAAQRFQQGTLRQSRTDACVEKQIDLSHQTFMQSHGKRDQGLKARSGAMLQR